ncbi:MAG TPA: DUF3499 domain-containing protein [Propionicimonas sp.]|nr:DUF3499 domain-containing protein [Propionicimonas sp.]HQA77127.1 DUF3499 domain-containing protein [Propionicimonas sp.]HQD96332.1 DUF3499 domain-containing protein [Propionicimonas sp.]
MINRRCSRSACADAAVATLTFAYSDSMAVLGPLALRAEPGTYDLCRAHSERLSVPRGWEVVRLPGDLDSPRASTDDLMALADAVRKVGLGESVPAPEPNVSRRKGHLAVLADPQ